MYEELKLPPLIKSLERVFEQFPEHRTGKNIRYDLADAGLSAFAVFFTQSPSFRASQRNLKLRKGRSNAENLFELRNLPSDNQIRNLLDPVSLMHLERCYRQTFQALEQTDILKRYRSSANQLLVAMDK